MYAQHRFDHAGHAFSGGPEVADALRLRASAALSAGLAGVGSVWLHAANPGCRAWLHVDFEDAWQLGSDWVLTGKDCQLCWPENAWWQVAALPGRAGQPLSLLCLGAAPKSRLEWLPGDAAAADAMERLVCRHIHPRQWPQSGPRNSPAAALSPLHGTPVAPETLPSVFTLAWTRELPIHVELPLSAAGLHCQGVPRAPRWRDSLCCLGIGDHQLELDCSRLDLVLHQWHRPAGEQTQSVVLVNEEGAPVMRLSSSHGQAWKRLLADVLYSPRGVRLSK